MTPQEYPTASVRIAEAIDAVVKSAMRERNKVLEQAAKRMLERPGVPVTVTFAGEGFVPTETHCFYRGKHFKLQGDGITPEQWATIYRETQQ